MGIVVNALSQPLLYMEIKGGAFGLAHFDGNWTSDQDDVRQQDRNKDSMFSRQNFTLRENQQHNDSERTDGKFLLLEISKKSY